MTEKEKMLSEQLYNAFDKELLEERQKAKKLCFDYNNTSPELMEERDTIISQLINTKGEFFIEPPFYCDYGYNITVGNNFYSNHGCVILDVCTVDIGDNVLIAPNVTIAGGSHPTDPKARLDGEEFGKKIKIGNNVWIGANSVIGPGVIIGDNSVIGAGSVVNKNIPANVVAVGTPCKVVKNI